MSQPARRRRLRDACDGRRVRFGCVYRSDELHALTDADLEAVAALGIRVVFDLRNIDERTARPNRLPDGVELLERVTPSTQGPTRTTEEQIVLDELPVRDDVQFAGVYTRLLEILAPELRIILERAVDAPTRPLLFHCAAGKDRTGITAAVLLGLLGVPDDVILDDYELTTHYFTARKLESLAGHMADYGITEERLRPLLEARRPVLAAMIDHVRDRWGGFDGYALDHVGVDAGIPDQLRAVARDVRFSDVGVSYDAVAVDYEARFRDELAGKPRDRELLEELAAAVGDPVLEIGCGPGQVGVYVRARPPRRRCRPQSRDGGARVLAVSAMRSWPTCASCPSRRSWPEAWSPSTR